MPPDPILALLSLVGLGFYAVAGGAVAALTVRLFDTPGRKYTRDLLHGGVTGAAPGAVFAALFWPAWVGCLIVVALGWGPGWLAFRTCKYIAAATLKE